MSTATQPVTPQRVMQYTFGFMASRALSAAVDLEIFTHIYQGADSLDELVLRSQASQRGVKALVEALTAMGLIQNRDERLSLSPDAEMFLVRTSRAYLGAVVNHMDWERWAKFTEAVRTGKPPSCVHGDDELGAFFAAFVDGLFALNWPAAEAAARQLGPQGKVLDVGAGSGVWSLAFAVANPQTRVTLVDRSEVIEKISQVFVERLNVKDRAQLQVGNFRELDLGQEQYDLAVLGHIMHGEGQAQSRVLLQRLHQALKPGGAVLVAEFIPDEGRREDVMALLFGLNMVMHTDEGCVFTRSELEGIARETGFNQVDWLQVPAPHPLAVFRK